MRLAVLAMLSIAAALTGVGLASCTRTTEKVVEVDPNLPGADDVLSDWDGGFESDGACPSATDRVPTDCDGGVVCVPAGESPPASPPVVCPPPLYVCPWDGSAEADGACPPATVPHLVDCDGAVVCVSNCGPAILDAHCASVVDAGDGIAVDAGDGD
jgi:hypothetical protein